MPSIDPVLAGQDIHVEISIDSDSMVRATLYFLGRAVTTGRAAGWRRAVDGTPAGDRPGARQAGGGGEGA